MDISIITMNLFVALYFALMNSQIQIRFITAIWARGCTWKQALDIYDLNGRYKNWLIFDAIANLFIMFLSSLVFTSNSWVSSVVIGLFGVVGLSICCFPIRFVGTKIAMQNNPNLLDLNGKYKNTCEEYKKLVSFLDEKNLYAYKKSVGSLWTELLLLNKRRTEAYKTHKKLEIIRQDVQKLITAYSLESDIEKKEKAQERLNKIIKQQAEINDFIEHVKNQLKNSETVFLDMRTKLSVGQLDNILPDLSNYTNQVKALEYTVETVEALPVIEVKQEEEN